MDEDRKEGEGSERRRRIEKGKKIGNKEWDKKGYNRKRRGEEEKNGSKRTDSPSDF